MSHVPFVDLRTEHARVGAELREAFDRVLSHSKLVLGPEVEHFEAEVAEFLGASHALGVSSGTDALLVALLALGVGEGDVVVTSPFTFIATAESIRRTGATPRFVDLDPASLDFDRRLLERALDQGARAVVPVHLYGHCGGGPDLVVLAGRHGATVIEDAAQAFGSTVSGRAAGTLGNAGCFSFFPTKVLGALGDGGLVVTDDAEVAERCRALREHGKTEAGYAQPGGNFRLDALQAAALSVKLRHLADRIERRRRAAAAYDAAFRTLRGIVPLEPRACDWNGALYTMRVPGGRREALRRVLSERGIETRVYYPRPVHLEPMFARDAPPLPGAESLSREVLSLPLHPWLSEAQVARVVEAVTQFFRDVR